MKTFQSFFILAILCVATAVSGAESYVFKVLANKGVSQVKSGAESDWHLVKTGETLQTGDELKVTENSYIGLVHKSGRTMELTTPGAVNVNELAAQLGTHSVTAASKYADFVINSLSENKASDRNHLEVTGAVDRTLNASPSIEVRMPQSTEVFEANARIHWEAVADAAGYHVTVKNVFDEVILDQTSTTNSISIDLDGTALKMERLIIVQVSVQDNEKVRSREYGIKRLSEKEVQKINAELSELGYTDNTSSLAEIMKASMFEQNNLLVDAASSYQRAIELSPEVRDFRKMYEAFLSRHGLK